MQEPRFPRSVHYEKSLGPQITQKNITVSSLHSDIDPIKFSSPRRRVCRGWRRRLAVGPRNNRKRTGCCGWKKRLDLSPRWQVYDGKLRESMANKMMRGGGRRSVKYEEVIILVAAGQDLLRDEGFETTRGQKHPCGCLNARLEQRKGGVCHDGCGGGEGGRDWSRRRRVEVVYAGGGSGGQ